MRSLYILKVGTTFPSTAARYGDFDTWTISRLGSTTVQVRVVDVEHGASLPAIPDCAGVIITGSHDMVTDDLPWSIAVERWLPAVIEAEVPLLGVCYGHQLLARSCGGDVGDHPEGKEIGTVDIDTLPPAAADPLLGHLPPRFPAHVTHAQTVLTLPPDATRLASNTFENCHAFRIGPCAWGVQFHPEYDANIMTSYIDEQQAELLATQRDVGRIRETVKETPDAASILRRFAEIAARKL